MRISFYRYSLLSRGGDRMVVEYANSLAKGGYNVTLWYSTLNTVFNLHPQIKLAKIPFSTKLGTIVFASLKKFHSDVIIVDIVPLASAMSFRNRSRLVYFAQDYDESYFKSPLKKLFIRILYFFCLKFMNVKTIAVSNGLTQILKEKYRADVRTVENGIDLSTFYPDPDRELTRIKGDRKAVLVLSRNEHRKGFDTAIKVINELSDECRDKIEVWACGEELDQKILKSLIRNFGWIAEDRLRKVISSADILFYPTRHEGFPLFPLEAMACGCCVVTTKAVPYLKDGENALVTEIGDIDNLKEKLESIIRDDLMREKLQRSGLRTVKRYDLKESQRIFEKAVADIFHSGFNPPTDKLTGNSSKR